MGAFPPAWRQDDFVSLCKVLGLPWPIQLPRIDEDGPHPVPDTYFTQPIIDTITRIDSGIFDQFGYRRAMAPFAPDSPSYDKLSTQDIRGQPK